MSYPMLSDLVRDVTGHDLPLPVPMFGLLVAAALLTTMWLTERELKRLYGAGRIAAAHRRVKQQDGARIDEPVAPQELVTGLAVAMVGFGIVGARIFHLLEYPQAFLDDPLGMIFTRSGFTIYGGLIFGLTAAAVFAKRHGLSIPALADALAPALMMGYAIGRIGCEVSGDGDWGIAANMALKPEWLPMGLWAQTYPHNIAGVLIAPPGVYPAPIYETLMSLVGFAVLWSVRKHSFRQGWLFALFMVLSGVERFLIEQIRINATFEFAGLAVTQAEIVAILFFLVGAVGLAVLGKRPSPLQQG
jgi:phosphatidylglycerol:prolipoprotein diacylglycerol transferase